MKHITKFVDTNLIDAEIKRLDAMRQELKKKNAVLRTRVNRMKKLVESVKQGDLFDRDSVD